MNDLFDKLERFNEIAKIRMTEEEAKKENESRGITHHISPSKHTQKDFFRGCPR